LYTVIIISILILGLLIIFYRRNQNKIKFYTTGLDSGFSLAEINLLWKLSRLSELAEPAALFWSIPALSKSISHIIEDAKRNGIEDSEHIQSFLAKLYKYRTKIEIEASKKKGISSTRELDEGQRLSIILPGKGVFNSVVASNGYNLAIDIPVKKGVIHMETSQWIGKPLHIYLWRKHDASYVFDTNAHGSGMYMGKPVLYLTHTNDLFRAQKRQAVRTNCHIFAQLFIIRSAVIDYSAIETEAGYRCLIEDISESGALIRIGGKGYKNIRLKIQFTLQDTYIVMYGTVCAVEYNEKLNQSRLHIDCFHIEPQMKNAILSFVYSILPQNEKDIYEAISQTDSEEQQEKKDEKPEDTTTGGIIIPPVVPDTESAAQEIPELKSIDEEDSSDEHKVANNESD